MNYLVKFIECIFKTLQQKDNNVGAEEHIISSNLFEVPNSVHLFYSFKEFVKMFYEFTNNILDVRINQPTRRMGTLFEVKGKYLNSLWKIYEEICSCGKSYTSETIRDVETG